MGEAAWFKATAGCQQEAEQSPAPLEALLQERARPWGDRRRLPEQWAP